MLQIHESRALLFKKTSVISNSVSTEESKGAVEALRDALKIAAHPENLVVLKACCKKTMPLNHFEMGMLSSKNGTVDAAVRALRLIHLENLREVQTKINEAVVVVQELTADPKTDKRLGKVGF
ncbi:unnamed protein product [Thelazia callipaeda]|uniref:TPR_REGION domain-containing protein n=1 Tax=Thelazia callipaeda TaxID=103827 RepID=A0A0N5D8Y6_THECL|nr:unnamed protein product [Thelazia callipaeda]